MESPSLEEFRRLVNGALGTWFSDGLGGAGLPVGLDDLMVFYNLNDSMVLIGIEHIHSVHRCAL